MQVDFQKQRRRRDTSGMVAAVTLLFLQLQDTPGNPSKARQTTQLTVTSSNTAVFNKTLQVQIPQGGSFVEVPVVPLQAGSTTFTITSPGLKTASVQFQALESPFSAQISASSLVIFTNGTATVTVTLRLDGQGVGGLNVAWSAVGGTMSPVASSTNAQGQATATLTPSGAGVANVNATASSFWSGSIVLGAKIIVGQPPAGASKGLVGTLLSFPFVLALAGAAAAAVILVLLFVRRRRRGGGAEEEMLKEESGFSYSRPEAPMDFLN